MAGEPWGAFPKLVSQDAAANNYPAITGAGYSVAIIDTGVDYNHPALGGGFGPGHKVVAGYDFVDNDTNPMDTDGHGTGVAGLAAGLPYTYGGQKFQGVAPGADIIALRIDDGTFGWAKESPLAKEALQWVIDHHTQYNIVAVNMSFGRGHYTSETSLAVIGDELAQLNQLGIMLVASSGNDGAQTPYGIEYPAADPNVYAVGSINSSDVISTFTERGPDMDILAPGENVTLPYFLPSTGQHLVLNTGWGTSFATPWITGMAALLKQIDPTLSPAEMMSIMKRSGSANFDGDAETAPYTGLTWSRLNINGALAMTYAERDDDYESNDSIAAATTLTFSNDTASISGLKLLKSNSDYFKFTLSATSDVDYALTLNGASFTPGVDLLDSHGTKLKTLAATESIRLSAGTYYLHVAAPSNTLIGTYGFDIDRTPDDGLNNHTPSTATPIDVSAGHGELTGLYLLGGLDDYYSFTLDATHDVHIDLSTGGSTPSAELLDTNGNFIATINGDLSRRLAAGRYLVRAFSSTSLPSDYAVVIDAAAFIMPGVNGTSNGIAYDAAGVLHFAWYDEASKNLKYATRSAQGVWSNPTVVDSNTMSGQFISLTLDSQGHTGIAYYDANNADLKYAHFNGSAWSVVTVDSSFTTGYYPSLGFDASDRPIISYYYKTGADLKFAYLDQGAWNISTIDSGYDVGRYSSLALNPATGRWATAYEDTTHGWFKYAEQGKNGWTITTVDNTTKIGGGYISLKFAPNKNPSFSYYDAFNANLKLATSSAGKWSTQVVASKGSVGLYSNLEIDDDGVMDILYDNKGADSVFQARYAGGVWNLTQITTDGGRWITRAEDDAGNQTLAYLRSTDLNLIDL